MLQSAYLHELHQSFLHRAVCIGREDLQKKIYHDAIKKKVAPLVSEAAQSPTDFLLGDGDIKEVGSVQQ